jgi:signal transduction histidine kinase
VNGRVAEWWRWYWQSPVRRVASTVAITAFLVWGSYGEAHPGPGSNQTYNGYHIPDTPDAALLLVAVACLVLGWRTRYPLTVLAISSAAVVSYSALGYENGAALVAPAIALFAVARQVHVRQSLLAALATLIALGAATIFPNPFGALGGSTELLPFLVAAPLFGGIAVRNRSEYVASIEARAEADASRRVDEERLRIARDLHDVVAHTMATINVQAGVAQHVLAENPAAVSDALQAIRQSSRDGLRELRAILNVLRQADEGDPTKPAPGLAQLDTLVANAGSAGLPVTLRRSGQPDELPPAVDLAAYRIVQESLTNVIKHAGPTATATVDLDFSGNELRVEVTDTGVGLVPGIAGAGGHGLIGMRERAASVGGTLETGPGPAGGYRVLAVLPAEPGGPADSGWPAAGSASAGPASTGSASTGSASTGSASTGLAT